MSSDYSLSEVQVALTPQERFDEYLQSKGKRTTQQRRTLIDHVFERHAHFDADELIESLAAAQKEGRAAPGKVSRATVYRALDELVEAGLLRKMELGGRAVYEHDYGYPQHDHLHCKECDALIEFQSEELLRLREAVGQQNGFRVTSHRLIITGICEECRHKRHRQHSPLDLI